MPVHEDSFGQMHQATTSLHWDSWALDDYVDLGGGVEKGLMDTHTDGQLSHRPSSCPSCGSTLSDQAFTWIGDTEAAVQVHCDGHGCDWGPAYLVLEIQEPEVRP